MSAVHSLTQVLFTRELRRRLAANEPSLALGVLAVHPGLVCTGVARGLPAWMQAAYYAIMGSVLLNCMQGARRRGRQLGVRSLGRNTGDGEDGVRGGAAIRDRQHNPLHFLDSRQPH